MPDAPRPDRLSREEVLVLQSHALRRWRESNWLATHHPREWLALEECDPTCAKYDMDGVAEEGSQPGFFMLAHGPEHLPFDDETLDAIKVGNLSNAMAREVWRVLRTAGHVHTTNTLTRSQLLTLGFEGEEDRDGQLVLRKVLGQDAHIAPLEHEVVLGDLKVSRPRLPDLY